MKRQSLLTRAMMSMALISSLSACAGGAHKKPVKLGPVDTGAGSLTAARAFLEGNWTLESFEVHPPGRPVIKVNGTGTLTYDGFGNLKMEIMVDRTTADQLTNAGIDIRNGVLSTTGRTVVDMPNKTLTYVIEGQQGNTGPLALSRVRHWQVDGDLLTLTTNDDAGQPVSVGRWRKAR